MEIHLRYGSSSVYPLRKHMQQTLNPHSRTAAPLRLPDASHAASPLVHQATGEAAACLIHYSSSSYHLLLCLHYTASYIGMEQPFAIQHCSILFNQALT